MTQVASRGAARRKRHERIRLHLAGTAARPRLAVFRSLNHIYAQVIDDASGRTLAAASSLEKELKGAKATKTEEAASRRAARRRAGQGRRRRARRLRSSRVPLPRADQVARRRRPRSRPRLLRKEPPWHGSTPTSSRSRSASSRSTASPRSSRAAGASASARSSSSVTARATSASGSARPARCPRRSARASRTRRRTSSGSRWSARRSRTRSRSSTARAASCSSPPRRAPASSPAARCGPSSRPPASATSCPRSLGSTNPVNVDRATIEALRSLHSAEELGARRGVTLRQRHRRPAGAGRPRRCADGR